LFFDDAAKIMILVFSIQWSVVSEILLATDYSQLTTVSFLFLILHHVFN